MLHDNYQIRLRVVFILLWLLLAVFASFGQNYRVRAVQNYFYVPDTAYSNQPFRIASPYLTDSTMVFRIHSNGYNFCVLTAPFQECRINALPGRYNWELLYRVDSTGWKRADGVVWVK